MVSVYDRGFMYGDGVFETLRTFAGRPFRLPAHLERLESSAEAIHLRLPRSREQIAADIAALLDRNGLGDQDVVVRIAVSRGRGVRGPSIRGADNPTLVVTCDRIADAPAFPRRDGIRLVVVPTRRIGSESLPAHAKHSNYLNSVLAHTEAQAVGADDALMLGVDGSLAECSGSNLFLVNGARILTPDLKTGILPGCTRAFVLDLCAANGLSADQARLDPGVLDDVEEVFVTNSVSGIVPVLAVDHREYTAPGPVTLMLQDLYRRGVEAELALNS
jgi:branched-chain amino acid aminotransferase